MVWDELQGFAATVCHLHERLPFLPARLEAVTGVVTPRVRESIARHAGSTWVESMGLLLGEVLRDAASGELAVVMNDCLPLEQTLGSRTSVQADAQSWAASWPSLPRGAQVVGWYHSHPGHGVFFSATDRQTQQRHFPHAWQVGLVCDPSTRAMGAFAGGECAPLLLVLAPA